MCFHLNKGLKVLDKFCDGDPGNTAESVVGADTGVVRAITFQSARMKRLFSAFSEVVLVDTTHGTNANRYKFFSFAIHDVFGRGQYVQHALVMTEEKQNLALAVRVFKKNNPDWTKIRVVMTDKALHEKEVLADEWPNARQLLCRWHVEAWLKKQCSRLGDVGRAETKQLKAVMKVLVNAESQQQYDDLKAALLATVDNDDENLLYKSFMTHWDTSTDEWVMFKRGGVPHLNNNANNRLESKWGRIKEVVDGNFTIDQLISMLITLHEYAEERYLAEFYRVGSRPPMSKDPELTALAMLLSEYAFRMVAEQHQLVVGPNASYDIELHGENTMVINPGTGTTHEVDARRCTCDCIFMQTCLQPCVHVMFVRRISNYETVIPPIRSVATRWIVQSPANNIEEGDVLTGCVNRTTCPPISSQAPIDGDAKYSHSKQLTEMIIDVMSIQPSTTYLFVMKWVNGFYTTLRTIKLEEFTGHQLVDVSGFTNLSQVSCFGSLSTLQLSFAENSTSAQLDEEIPTPITPRRDAGTKVLVKKPKSITTTLKNRCKFPDDRDRAAFVFASPPKRKGMARRVEKKEASRKVMEEVKPIRTSIREEKKAHAVILAHMSILSGPYSRSTANPLVDQLELPSVEVSGVLVIRQFNVNQSVPVITAIPQREKLREVIEAIAMKDNPELLGRWNDYGCATYSQLKLMDRVSARNNFNLVQNTLDWID